MTTDESTLVVFWLSNRTQWVSMFGEGLSPTAAEIGMPKLYWTYPDHSLAQTVSYHSAKRTNKISCVLPKKNLQLLFCIPKSQDFNLLRFRFWSRFRAPQFWPLRWAKHHVSTWCAVDGALAPGPRNRWAHGNFWITKSKFPYVAGNSYI